MSLFRDKARYHFDLESLAMVRHLEPEELWRASAAGKGTSPESMTMLTLAITRTFLTGTRQVFELGHVLLSLFDRTDMGKLTGGMLRLPYPALYLHLEQGEEPALAFELQGSDERVPVTGIYVVERGEGVWAIGLVHHSRARTRPAALSWIWDHGAWTDSEETFDVYTARVLGEALQGDHAETYLKSLRIITHTLLYLRSPTPELEEERDATLTRLVKSVEKHKGRRLEASRAQLEEEFSAARTITYVGRSYEGSAPRGKGAGGETGSVAGHWVRGHWHHYWVGKKDAQRLEPRWVQPFIRGEAEAQTTRVYRVSAHKETEEAP